VSTTADTSELCQRQVVVLNETTTSEAVALFRALADGPPTPEAVALDYLIDENPTQRHDSA
jgi:hypothetical protein